MGEGGRERGAWGLLRVIIIGLAVGDGGVLLLGGKRMGLGRGDYGVHVEVSENMESVQQGGLD